jgi:hypothetical protein
MFRQSRAKLHYDTLQLFIFPTVYHTCIPIQTRFKKFIVESWIFDQLRIKMAGKDSVNNVEIQAYIKARMTFGLSGADIHK